MALIHTGATLTPSKLEVLQEWVPAQPWAAGLDTGGLTAVGAYRFDDPAGAVGIETHLLATGDGTVLQVPTTYRAGPLTTGVRVATVQHSELGDRWVYDACTDPVGVTAFVAAILTGGRQAELELVTDSGATTRTSTTTAVGSGSELAVPDVARFTTASVRTTTVVTAGPLVLVVEHVLGRSSPDAPRAVLEGRWPDHDDPTLLAWVR